MGIGDDKKQIPVVLPKKIIELLDQDKKKELRSRSAQVAKIIIDYYEQKEKDKS